MNSSTRATKLILSSSLAATFAMAGPAFAAVPVGSGSSYDLSVHINAIGITALNVDAQTQAVITSATQNAQDGHQVNSLSVADPLNLIKLQTGTLTSQAQYVAGNVSAIVAQSMVENLDLSASTFLSILANAIVSTSSLSGSCPELATPRAPIAAGLLDDFIFFDGFDGGGLSIGGGNGSGGLGGGGVPPSGSDLAGLQISLNGTSLGSLPSNPPPNTVITLPVGATLVLNERTVSGDGVHDLALATNALHLTLDIVGLVTAEVVIAHSDASLHCP